MNRLNVLAFFLACFTSLALVHSATADEAEPASEVTEETFDISADDDGC